MKRIKNSFSIKNLENISGIKAHTIRIWEKRYNLLQPERTDTNIRRYSLDSLRKLLNITLLYNHGIKISKIANLPEKEIPFLVREIALKSSSEQVSINAFKLSMVNFDITMFDATYDELMNKNDFSFIYLNIFVPLMSGLGILWQTGAISPSHEHFITNLIKQKIHIQTELMQRDSTPQINASTFVLYLPENEIHELSILFLNYFVLNNGFKTIFLGQSIPTVSLKTLLSYSPSLHFVTYVTVEPNKEEIDDYLAHFNKELIENTENQLSIFGPQVQHIDKTVVASGINVYDKIEDFVEEQLNLSVFV
ncbi:MerR family transcriptional regulator [Flavobacteriaceae bacterium]|mgnify:FL=1|jgi:DNA-binding transcriptional MerR regulator|nr:MerR family transcriptional regulator [Flavobacteriaceae bacterium]